MSIAAERKSVLEAVPKQLLIGGEWRDASGGARFAVEDPATGETLCEIADATAEDAIAALDAAVAAGRVGRHAAQRAHRDPLAGLRAAAASAPTSWRC